VVGVALQYYGTAIAFLVGHFASDSGGKKRWHRRDDDAWRTLHMMHLAGSFLLPSLSISSLLFLNASMANTPFYL